MAEDAKNPLRSELADRLDEIPVAAIMEYVAHRLVDGEDSRWVLTFEMDKGKVRRFGSERPHVGVTEMEEMGGRRT